MGRINKYFLSFLIFLFLSACASDGWYAQQAREKFIRLSPRERNERREKWKIDCKNFITIDACLEFTLPEPTAQELERLKNKDFWRYKIRSWYYGIWD